MLGASDVARPLRETSAAAACPRKGPHIIVEVMWKGPENVEKPTLSWMGPRLAILAFIFGVASA